MEPLDFTSYKIAGFPKLGDSANLTFLGITINSSLPPDLKSFA
jgi:hypothetical protein